MDELLAANGIQPKSVCEVGWGAGEVLHQLECLYGSDVTVASYEVIESCYTATALELATHTWKPRAMRLPRRLLHCVSARWLLVASALSLIRSSSAETRTEPEASPSRGSMGMREVESSASRHEKPRSGSSLRSSDDVDRRCAGKIWEPCVE